MLALMHLPHYNVNALNKDNKDALRKEAVELGARFPFPFRRGICFHSFSKDDDDSAE